MIKIGCLKELAIIVNYVIVAMEDHQRLANRNVSNKCQCLLMVVMKFSEVHQYLHFIFLDEEQGDYYCLRSFKFVVCFYVSINKQLIVFPLFDHRDGNLPVSFIQKYLVKKLDLTSEAEVSFQSHSLKLVSGVLTDIFHLNF